MKIERNILDCLKLYNPSNCKKRYGNAGDGGYVVVDGYEYDCYFSCGIGNDASFDNSFASNHPGISGLLFDGCISSLPFIASKDMMFVSKNISFIDTENTTSLNLETISYSNIFLKMDIESHEWKWIKHFSNFHKIKQFVIEVHGLFDPSWIEIGQYEYDDIFESLDKINQTHHLVHFHSNSAAEYRIVDGIELPTVAELTYIRKHDCQIIGFNKTPLPILDLDCKNTSYRHDLSFTKYPFCVD